MTGCGAETDHEVGADGDQEHHEPGSERDAVPPGGLGVSLRIQDIVHAYDGDGAEGVGVAEAGTRTADQSSSWSWAVLASMGGSCARHACCS